MSSDTKLWRLKLVKKNLQSQGQRNRPGQETSHGRPGSCLAIKVNFPFLFSSFCCVHSSFPPHWTHSLCCRCSAGTSLAKARNSNLHTRFDVQTLVPLINMSSPSIFPRQTLPLKCFPEEAGRGETEPIWQKKRAEIAYRIKKLSDPLLSLRLLSSTLLSWLGRRGRWYSMPYTEQLRLRAATPKDCGLIIQKQYLHTTVGTSKAFFISSLIRGLEKAQLKRFVQPLLRAFISVCQYSLP